MTGSERVRQYENLVLQTIESFRTQSFCIRGRQVTFTPAPKTPDSIIGFQRETSFKLVLLGRLPPDEVLPAERLFLLFRELSAGTNDGSI